MPTYEYRCKKCRRAFEVVMGIKDHEKRRKPKCPKCGSQSVQQRPSMCQVVTTTKA